MNKLLFTLIVCSNLIFGQTAKFDSLLEKGIDQIYSLQFKSAEQTFLQFEKKYPDRPEGKFFEAMITWWKIMVDLDNKEYDKKFKDQLDDVIDFCDDILDKNSKRVDAIFFKGGAYGFKGRLASIREDWMDAAGDGKEAMPLVYDAYELDPDNKDVQLGFGIYNYYADVIPKKYSFLKPVMFFFPKGNRKKGLEQLEDVAKNGKYTKVETKYFLMTIYFSFEDNYGKAQEYAEDLAAAYPDNAVFEKYVARIKRKQYDMQGSVEAFKSIYAKADSGLTGYNDKTRREAAYYIGENYFNKGKWDNSLKYFEECVTLSRKVDNDEDTGFLISAMIFAAKIYDVRGERSKAVKYYKEVLDMDEYKTSHKVAKKYLKTPYGK